jgi:hypothetical protein
MVLEIALCTSSKGREIVRSIVYRRPSLRRKDLPVLLSPLGMVYAIDPVLRLNRYAAVLIDEFGTSSCSTIVALHLARLNRYCSILADTAVECSPCWLVERSILMPVAEDHNDKPGKADASSSVFLGRSMTRALS